MKYNAIRYNGDYWIGVPKCGCACFRAWLFSIAFETNYEDVDQIADTIHGWYYSNAVQIDGKNEQVYALVRDPVERIISAYFDKVKPEDSNFPDIKIWLDHLEWAAGEGEDMNRWNSHWRPISSYIPSGATILQLERLPQDSRTLGDLKGIKFPRWINRKQGISKKAKVSFAQRQRIARLYKEDLDRFYPHLIQLYGVTH